MNDYYVYEWIRLDTNEPFYVGKGKGKHKSCGKLSNGIKLSWKYLKDFLEECKYQLL